MRLEKVVGMVIQREAFRHFWFQRSNEKFKIEDCQYLAIIFKMCQNLNIETVIPNCNNLICACCSIVHFILTWQIEHYY